MSPSRRHFLDLGLAFGLAAALDACGPRKLATKPGGPPPGRPLDTHRLDHAFPALAARARPGAFAFGVMDLATTTAWYWNTNRGFPLASASAAPVAAAALAQVDLGKLSLDERVGFDALDLSPPPSLIAAAFPAGAGKQRHSIRAADLFALAVREGDATAIDVLAGRIGGPGAVGAFLQMKGITGLRVDRYKRETLVAMFGMPTFRPAWKSVAAFDAARDQIAPGARQAAMDAFIVDQRDTSTVPAALGFLAMLADGELVSPRSTALLLGWMATAPGSRFRPGLPAGVRLAHVGGATPGDLGYTPAAAELAIATWPNGRRYALAGFLVASTGTAAQRSALFADAARLAAGAIG
ncbi:MAG TPA: serine hydrolase [Caulobacteraceae bacterium]